MNEQDALERELAALKPAPPSPLLKNKIAAQLERPRPSRGLDQYSARRIWRLSLALAIALAILGVLRTRWHLPQQPQSPVRSSAMEVGVALNPSLPTLWNLHQAAANAPYDIDALLDRYSRAGESSRSLSAFSVLTSTNDSQLGEL